MTRKVVPSEQFDRKLADLDEDTQDAIRVAVDDIADEPNMNRRRRRTDRGGLLDFGAAKVGFGIEYSFDEDAVVPYDLVDLR